MTTLKGSCLGGALIVLGSCIGAGMLALPLVTGILGFFPSLFMLFFAWIFSMITALLIVEVHASFLERVNLLSMAKRTLGWSGKWLSGILYLFLFYSLLVAYISGIGNLAATYLNAVFSIPFPPWAGAIFFTLFFGWLAYQGTHSVDYWNRFFVAGKITAYLGMVFLSITSIQSQLLSYVNFSFLFFSLPLLIISFGYHNIIPTLCDYLKNDLHKIKKSIFLGSFAALLIYLIWNLVVLGILPIDGEWGITSSLKKGLSVSDVIVRILGVSWIGIFAEILAFFALLSSFLAQALALIHFFADAFRVKGEKHESVPLCVLTLLPPLIFALVYPDFFIQALNFGGGVCASLLFGVFPAIMVWKNRRQYDTAYRVAGGKSLLIAVMLIGCFVLIFQLANMFHLTLHV